MKEPIDSSSPAQKVRSVECETARAYCDCHSVKPWGEGNENVANSQRSLNFRASVSIPRDEAVRILRKYVKGYNEFKPALLLQLPETCSIRIAREGSVCVYVESAEVLDVDKMKVDEFHRVDDYGTFCVYRLWWD